MGNPVVHFEIVVRDAAKSQEFYANLFDWHVNADNPMSYGMVDTHSEGGIGGGITGEGVSTGVTFYVQVDDLQAYLDKAESLGGKTIMPPMEIPDMVKFAVFSDPEGNVIGIVT